MDRDDFTFTQPYMNEYMELAVVRGSDITLRLGVFGFCLVF